MGGESGIEDEEPVSRQEIEKSRGWVQALGETHAIKRGVIIPGVGKHLDILDEEQEGTDFVHKELESFLRHVETKRRRSITEFSEVLSEQQKLYERICISVLFSRHARRNNDPRFLNAAFKLNEWLISSYQKMKDDYLRSFLLLALAEQEFSAKELIG